MSKMESIYTIPGEHSERDIMGPNGIFDGDGVIGQINHNSENGELEVTSPYTDRILVVPQMVEDEEKAAKEFAMAEMDRALSFNNRWR